MNKKLGDNDAMAVDLLLDRSNMSTSSNTGNSFAAPVGDSVVRRIGATEAVFRLIAEMPASEPPAGLAKRTVERIYSHGISAPAPSEQARPDLGQNRPSA